MKIIYVFNLIKANWKAMSIVIVSIMAIVGVYIFSLPRSYTSQTILLPESSSNNGMTGNLGSLASLAGIKIGGSTDDAIYPEFYPKVLSSSVYLVELSKEKIFVNRLHKKVSIYDYFNIYQRSPWWSRFSGKDVKDYNSNANPTNLTKGQDDVLKALQKSGFCMVDKKTDMITIKVETQDADVSAQIADLMCKRLQAYITDYRTSKARKDLAYVQKITTEAKRKYLTAQQKYANYCDANQDIVLSSFEQVRDRLENDMQLAFNMYSQSTQQLQLAQAKLQEKTPAFTVIQPAIVPLKPSAPKRMATLFIVFLVSAFGSVLWFVVRDYLKSASSEVKK